MFIPTTRRKFDRAETINDLFDDSPLEDLLWGELKKQEIGAERQWLERTARAWYSLDFALFCDAGKLDVETDGLRWHVGAQQAARDYPRDNALQSVGWRILRFSSQDLRESMGDYCLPEIGRMINQLGGLSQDGLVPRTFHGTPNGLAQQPALFEEPEEYIPD